MNVYNKILKVLCIKKSINDFSTTKQVDRWKKENNLFSDWDERTILMAQFIPENSSILEFGAGRLVLKNHLPPGCSYTPSDIVSRSPDTIVFDLNKDNPAQLNNFDVVFFSGVLEYVIDLQKLIKSLSVKTSSFIVSYSSMENYSSEENRKKNGWVNNYYIHDFKLIFFNLGFQGDEVNSWRGQRIMVFTKINKDET